MKAPLLQRLPWHGILAAVLALAWLILVRQALTPFFAAMVLAYLLHPLAERLRPRLGRGGAALLLLLATLLVLGALLVWLVPVGLRQAERLVAGLPALQETAEQRWLPWIQDHPWVERELRSLFQDLEPQSLLKNLEVAGAGLVGFFLRLLSYLLVPVILYYLLVDGPAFLANLEDLVPPRHRSTVCGLVGTIHARMGGFIRGQIGVAAVMSVLQGLAFLILGIPYAPLLGLAAGCANVVPYLPYATALPAALVISAGSGAGPGRLLTLLLVFLAIQKVEALYLTPVWVGRASRLHPLEVLLAVLTFGSALGLVGLVFAVPMMIVLKVAYEHLAAQYRAHHWYGGDSEAP